MLWPFFCALRYMELTGDTGYSMKKPHYLEGRIAESRRGILL